MALVVALSNRADLAQQVMFWMLGGPHACDTGAKRGAWRVVHHRAWSAAVECA
jgi:hypothetical protein